MSGTGGGLVARPAKGYATESKQDELILITEAHVAAQEAAIGTRADISIQNGNDGTLISLIKGISKSLYGILDRFVNKQIIVDRFEYTSPGVVTIPSNCTKIEIYIPTTANIEIDGRPVPANIEVLPISDDHGRVLSIGTINVTAVGGDPVFVLTYSFN